MMDDITAAAPSPKSRGEAWLAWESSLLSGLAKKARKHRAKFGMAYNNNNSRWFLYAKAERPNRGEILVELHTGEEMWVNIMKPTPGLEKLWTFKIGEDFPDLRDRQQEIWQGGVNATAYWTYVLTGEGSTGKGSRKEAAARLNRHLEAFVSLEPGAA